MSDKPVTWSQGIAVVGGAFGICCLGFMLLHGMVGANRAEAAGNLSTAISRTDTQLDRVSQMFESYRSQNYRDHKEIMTLLLTIKRELQ